MKSPGGVEEPTRPRKPRRNSAGSRGPFVQCSSTRAMNSSAAGMPRAAPNAGGSITVSERRSSGRRAAREQRDDAAVGVADEVRSGLQELLEPYRLVLEIDLLDVRPGRKTAPVRRHDLEPVGEGFLGAPGQVRVDYGTVN